ncbi:MAG: hypothetical protein ACYS9X_09270 [Planctomycetota bacterium]
MENAEAAPGGRVILELKPDLRTALKYYMLLAVASTLGVAVCVILFAGAAAGSLALLAIQVGMMEFAFHFALAGVFYDFYRQERGRTWRFTSDGVTMSGGDEDERSIPWPAVDRAYPKGSSVCLETGSDAEPLRLFFISAAGRESFYRLYLAKTMFPFEDRPG